MKNDREIAEQLVRDGWQSTSNKYRVIARLPEGKTGLEAVREVDPIAYKRIMEHAERQAEAYYRRMLANTSAGTQQTLDESMWRAFKKAGGEASF